MENRSLIDDDRLTILEEQFKQAKFIADERELMYDEVCFHVPVNLLLCAGSVHTKWVDIRG